MFYRLIDDCIQKVERRPPLFQETILDEANCSDVVEISYTCEPVDHLWILFKDDLGRVIFKIDRDVIYPPIKKNPQVSQFHKDLWGWFVAPVATDKVICEIDLELLIPKNMA